MDRFDIVYDSILQRLTVLQNGNLVSSYSQFAGCNGQPFFNWYDKLPQSCFSEANGRYAVTLESDSIFMEILRKTFLDDPNCYNIQIRKPIISISHRMRWADELLGCSNFSALSVCVPVSIRRRDVPLLASPILTRANAEGTIWRFSELNRLTITLQLGTSSFPAIASLSNGSEITRLSKGNYHAVAAILPTGKEIEFVREECGVFLFSCSPNHLPEFLKMWVLSLFLPAVLNRLQQELSDFHNWKGVDPKIANAKRQLLTAREPYMRLKLPPKIEIGRTGFFSFVKLPEDMRCKAHSNTPDIALLEQGNVIRPQREGLASFTVSVQDYPEFSVTEKTTVYRYIEVTRIQLSASKNVLREGERLTIHSAFHPSGADNIGEAQWIVSPGGILRPEPNGVFLALRSGSCNIRVTVGKVTESISVTVAPKPTGITFDRSDVTLRLGDNSQCVLVDILPIGSQGGQALYRVSDAAILQFNENNGQLTPLAEGDAIVTADLVYQGALMDSANCHVTILPPKDIITPNGSLIFLIAALLTLGMLYATPYRFIPGILSAIGVNWYCIRRKNAIIIALGVISSLILCALLLGMQ